MNGAVTVRWTVTVTATLQGIKTYQEQQESNDSVSGSVSVSISVLAAEEGTTGHRWNRDYQAPLEQGDEQGKTSSVSHSKYDSSVSDSKSKTPVPNSETESTPVPPPPAGAGEPTPDAPAPLP